MLKTRGKNIGQKGYSWCGGRCRWGTTKKLQVRKLFEEG